MRYRQNAYTMKKIVLTLLLLAVFLESKAQKRQPNEALPTEVAQKIYAKLLQARETQNPPIAELIKIPYATNLPAGLSDTLYKYDWGKIRSFHLEDSPDDVIYTWKFSNFEVYRYAPKKVAERFEANSHNGKTSLTFFGYEGTSNYRVVKVGKYHYIANEEDDGTSYARIVSYANGILIYDVCVTGQIDGFEDTNRIFRVVTVALPQLFGS